LAPSAARSTYREYASRAALGRRLAAGPFSSLYSNSAGERMSQMPDHWNYVLAAYGLAAVALIGYWRYLRARARALSHPRRGRGRNP
jgi:hypothetical protein